MDRAILDEIRACLERDRMIFYYFRDRYALFLLQWAIGEGRTVRELRGAAFGRLLEKPSVRQWLGRQGKSFLKGEDVAFVWENPALAYRLTLGHWPLEGWRWSRRYHQMTRQGHNLVLQLNFPISHNRELLKIVGEEEARGEILDAHPVAHGREWTLAWARLDIDLETGEALIEEIQSDWVRDVAFNEYLARRYAVDEEWIRYAELHLKSHTKVWAEVMLSAALWLLREEIGIRRIFYHTHETGRRLKHLGYSCPPRSLYTDLPRKFCFERTHNGPLFLRDDRCRSVRRAVRDPKTDWFVLQLPAA